MTTTTTATEWHIKTATLEDGGAQQRMSHLVADVKIVKTRPMIGALQVEVILSHDVFTDAHWMERLQGQAAVDWLKQNTIGGGASRSLTSAFCKSCDRHRMNALMGRSGY